MRTPWILLLALMAAPALAGDPLEWEPANNKIVSAFNQGIDLLNGQQLGAAEAKFRKVLTLQPGFGPAWMALGQTLYQLDQPADAIPLFVRVAEEPDHPEALTSLAWALFGAQRFDESQDAASRAVDAQPGDADAWQALVMAELRLGTDRRIADRIAAAREARDRPDLACCAVQVFTEMGGLEQAEAAMHLCRDSENPALVGNADTQLRVLQGDGSAITERTVELGDDSGAAYARAVEAFNAQDFAGAEGLCTRAMKLDHPTPAPLLLRAEARYEQDKRAAALKDLQAVLGDDGSWVRISTRGNLAGVLTKRHELDLLDRMHGAAALLVLLHVRAADLDRADQAVIDARTAFGDFSALYAADATLAAARGEAGRAWLAISAALRDSPGRWTHRLASRLAFEAASTATEEAVDTVLAHGAPSVVFNLATGASNANLGRLCVRVVDALSAEGAERSPGWEDERLELVPRALALGYTCAVRSPDLAAAERLGARASWSALDAWSLVKHADLLYRDGQHAAAVAHLDRTGGTTGEQAPWAVALMARCAADLDRLDEVARWARHAVADAPTRYFAGATLAAAHRLEEARELLGSACPELSDDAGASCADTLARVEQALAQ